jgi:flagellar biosynthesis GTPase FlhF
MHLAALVAAAAVGAAMADANTAGMCPVVQVNDPNAQPMDCQIDNDCAGYKKCCSYASGMTCLMPVFFWGYQDYQNMRVLNQEAGVKIQQLESQTQQLQSQVVGLQQQLQSAQVQAERGVEAAEAGAQKVERAAEVVKEQNSELRKAAEIVRNEEKEVKDAKDQTAQVTQAAQDNAAEAEAQVEKATQEKQEAQKETEQVKEQAQAAVNQAQTEEQAAKDQARSYVQGGAAAAVAGRSPNGVHVMALLGVIAGVGLALVLALRSHGRRRPLPRSRAGEWMSGTISPEPLLTA